MKITEIKPRRKRLSAVYIDGEFAVSLDTQTLIENRFDVGREIDDEDLHEIIKLSNERRAKEKALWLLSYREHSKKELEDKIRRTADETSAQKAVDRMEELGLVDDERFARHYAEKLLNSKHMSKRGIAFELTRKGIDKETAEQLCDELDIDVQPTVEDSPRGDRSRDPDIIVTVGLRANDFREMMPNTIVIEIRDMAKQDQIVREIRDALVEVGWLKEVI